MFTKELNLYKNKLNTKQIHTILKKYWGFNSFRPKQEEIIMNIFQNIDCLALLPTGGGKSICFQIPAIAMKGTCLVISPLIALMNEQVGQLKKRGVKSIALSKGMSHAEVDIALDNCIYGKIKLLYISPERLQSDFVRERIKKINVSFIAIDEAHCISEWGHDFRPAYRKLSQLRKLLPQTPVMALTATATKEVAIDIQNQLQFRVKNIIQTSFKRENLSYLVLEESQKIQRIEKMLHKVKGSALIYVRSRKKADELSQELNHTGFKSGAYHAGISRNDRDLIQEKWMNNKLRIIVATNAFGMGIDKADVRLVIHNQSPATLEAYFQEAGRAGRDNKKSFAVLLFQVTEIKNLQEQFEESYPSILEVRRAYQDFANFFQISNGDGQDQSFNFDIDTFCKRYSWNKRKCVKILQILVREELILFNQFSKKSSSILLTCPSGKLINYKSQNPKKLELIKLILRMYPGVFEVAINIKEINLAFHLNKKSHYIVKMLNQLEEEGLITYKKRMHTAEITLLSPRYESKYLPLATSQINNRKKILLLKTKQLQNYISNKNYCRSQVLLNYFDEKDSIACGICDICLSNEFDKPEFKKQLRNELLESLKENSVHIPTFVKKFNKIKLKMIINEINLLVESNILVKNGEILRRNDTK